MRFTRYLAGPGLYAYGYMSTMRCKNIQAGPQVAANGRENGGGFQASAVRRAQHEKAFVSKKLWNIMDERISNYKY